jgi:hypothetical protein
MRHLAGSGFRFLRTSALLLIILQFTLVLAESWTIQTVAYPDYRQAVETLEELQALGFDAYTEFTISSDGRQFARVRIGCFTDRHGAELFARSLRGVVVQQAVVQPLNAGASVSFCLESEVGFLKPGDWEVERQSNTEIVFRVQVAGYTGYIRRADGEWQLLPEPVGLPEVTGAGSGIFRQVNVAGIAAVAAQVAAGERIACLGTLLWQNGSVAVVERASTVIACVVNHDYQQFLP